MIGTPSVPPKPRGKSSGWPTGKVRIRRIRYPTVKKTTTKQKKEQPKSGGRRDTCKMGHVVNLC